MSAVQNRFKQARTPSGGNDPRQRRSEGATCLP